MNKYDLIFLFLPAAVYFVSLYNVKLGYIILIPAFISAAFNLFSSYIFFIYSILTSAFIIYKVTRINRIDRSSLYSLIKTRDDLQLKLKELKEKAEALKDYEKKNQIIYSLIKIMSVITDTEHLRSVEKYINSYTQAQTSLIYYGDNVKVIYGKKVDVEDNGDVIKKDSFYAINIREKDKRIFSLVVHSSDHSGVDDIKDLVEELYSSFMKVYLFETSQNMSQNDGLTGLFRRAVFNEKLEQEIIKARNFKYSIGLMMIDIDHFKYINDTYGHQAGDEVLKEVAKLIKNNVYETDFVARYGGEEFAVIMPRAQIDGSFRKAEYIRNIISQHRVRVGLVDLKITVSCGIAYFPYDADDDFKLIEMADKALYFSKEHGRNRVTLYRDISNL